MDKKGKSIAKGSEKEKTSIDNTSKDANVEELDIEGLEQVTGGSLRSTIRTNTTDISGNTQSKI